MFMEMKTFLCSFAFCLAIATAEAANYPKGCYGDAPADNPIPDAILRNPGIVGVMIAVPWKEVEPAENKFEWSNLDARIDEAKTSGKKVVISITASAVKAPEWLLNNPKVQKLTVTDPNKFHQTGGQPITVALPWDPIFHAKKLEMIREAGAHFSKNPTVVAVMAGFANYFTNDWAIPPNMKNGGYSYEKLLQVGKDVLTETAKAFPNQAIKLPIGINRPTMDPDKRPTQMAEDILAFAKNSTFADRFYAQMNSINTNTPMASDIRSRGANKREESLRLLKDVAQHFGLQMVASATRGESDGCRQNARISPCPPVDVLNKSIKIAMSYKPAFLEFWQADARNQRFYPLLEKATRDMQGN